MKNPIQLNYFEEVFTSKNWLIRYVDDECIDV